MSPARMNPLTSSAFPWGNAGGPTSAPCLGSPCPRSPPAGPGTWARMPGGKTGSGPPGGARGRRQAPRSPGPRRPCVGSPGSAPAPRTPIQVRAAGAAGSARPGPVHLAQARGSRVDPRVPGAEQSPRQVPGLCPPRAPAGVGGPAGADERPPRAWPPPPPVNYAGGWHRRARVAKVSLATFARASIRPRSPRPRRLRWVSGRRGRLETPTAHSPPELGPLDCARRCDPSGGPRCPGSEGAGIGVDLAAGAV